MRVEYEALSKLVGKNFAVLADGRSVYLTPKGSVRDMDNKELLPEDAGRAKLYRDNIEKKTAVDGNLPDVDASDNGKVLMVDGGEWAAKKLPVYEGVYSITPSADNAQVLATGKKYMDADLVVEKIPFYRISDEDGGETVYIG